MRKCSVRCVSLSLLGTALVFSSVLNAKTQQPAPAPAPSSTAIPQAPSTPPQKPVPSSNMRRAFRRFTYVCEGGEKVLVGTSGGSTRVIFKNHIYTLKQVEAASGMKYSDGSVIWWSKDEGGFLEDDSKPEKKQMLAKDCHLQTPAIPPANTVVTPTGVVSGTVSYLQRIAMPPDAVLIVQLQDVSVADASATAIAEQKITFGQRQVPIPFELKFDPAKIASNHTYSVSARILVGSDLRFNSDKPYLVLTQGNPPKVDLILVAATPPPSH